METVNFYPKTFRQIPEQDNPAFGEDECLMIVRECLHNRESKRSTVLHIKPDPIEAVTSIAVFWRIERALEYCDIINNKKHLTKKSQKSILAGTCN